MQQLRVELRLPERCKAVEAVLTGRVQLAIGSAERFQDLTVSHRWPRGYLFCSAYSSFEGRVLCFCPEPHRHLSLIS